ncbi:hypothetical protein SHKM778_42480 [Streptomyces sp. KM77-8]|uniref:Uncharacterized protein n=1 Tax=Streptomyces haneummycinicus TaxID=3074435 RepID=A0AAT9HKB7_9ACTN
MRPIHTFGTVNSDFDFQDPNCAQGEMWSVCWPTIAPSSFEHYGASRAAANATGTGLPGWENSLVMTTLKDGAVYRVDLTPNGQEIAGITKIIVEENRFRDTEFSADGTSSSSRPTPPVRSATRREHPPPTRWRTRARSSSTACGTEEGRPPPPRAVRRSSPLACALPSRPVPAEGID